jgi:translation initiation factor 1 (eIF-1/SUI1)
MNFILEDDEIEESPSTHIDEHDDVKAEAEASTETSIEKKDEEKVKSKSKKAKKNIEEEHVAKILLTPSKSESSKLIIELQPNEKKKSKLCTKIRNLALFMEGDDEKKIAQLNEHLKFLCKKFAVGGYIGKDKDTNEIIDTIELQGNKRKEVIEYFSHIFFAGDISQIEF